MLCVRECPTWCISIQAHQELEQPDARRPRINNVLDSFTLDWGLCMFCGICVDVCPFDALHWDSSPVPASGQRQDLVAEMTSGAGSADSSADPVVAPDTQ